jgi:sugar phosphate isomerase/epimerase
VNLLNRLVPGFTYHIFPQIAKNKTAICELLAPLLEDPFWGGVQIPPLLNREVAVRLGKLLRVAGMSAVYGVGQSLARAGLDLHSLDEGVRRSSVEQAKKYVDEAYLIGARLMDLNPGKDPGPEHRERAKEAAVESLTRLCEYAASRATDYVLPLSMENFDRELDKKLLLGPTAETIEVVAAVRRRCPNMGITPDLAHLMILGEDPAQSVREMDGMVFHAHLANYIIADRNDPRWGDSHPPFWVEGSEVYPEHVAAYFGALDDIGYFDAGSGDFGRRLVTFEIRPGENESSSTVIAGSARLLRRASQRLGEES